MLRLVEGDVLAVRKLLVVKIWNGLVPLGLIQLEDLPIEALNLALVLQILNQLLIESLVELNGVLLDLVVLCHETLVVLLVRVYTISLYSSVYSLEFLVELSLFLQESAQLFLKIFKVFSNVNFALLLWRE